MYDKEHSKDITKTKKRMTAIEISIRHMEMKTEGHVRQVANIDTSSTHHYRYRHRNCNCNCFHFRLELEYSVLGSAAVCCAITLVR